MTQITITGTEQVIKRLESLTKIDYKPALLQVSQELKTEYQDKSFNQEGSNLGTPWKSRKPPTGTHPLLQKTGKMRRGFTTKTDKRSTEIGNKVSYFKYHQTGTRKMVARPMMAITSSITRRIGIIFSRFIKNYLSK